MAVAFTEADRVEIRRYLGFGDLYLQQDPRLENAITSAQSTAIAGGTRPTDDAANAIKGVLYGYTTVNGRYIEGLQDIQADISQLARQQGALSAGGDRGAKLDSAREHARLRMRGRELVHQLARMLDTYPRSDIFSAAPMLEEAMPDYPHSPY